MHDWGGGDGFLEVTLPAFDSVIVVLQWNQPFGSVSLGKGSEIDLDLYLTPTPDATGLANPLSADLEVMRTSLMPGVLSSLVYNQARQQDRVRLFEPGHHLHRRRHPR